MMAAIADKPFPTSSDLPVGESNPPSRSAGSSSNPVPGSTMPADHHLNTTQDDDMLSRVVQGAHQTIDRLAETAAPHVQRLQEGVGARAEHVKEVGDEWAESLRCTVRDNPLAAVATALALGVLIARLTQR
jgi:ElaB/YqjD/DUF883 family membrane-anchored ribosome-binding protein